MNIRSIVLILMLVASLVVFLTVAISTIVEALRD